MTADRTGRLLGVFAKYWEPGQVKTRLAATTGAGLAADIYRECVLHLTRRLATAGGQRQFCFWPPESERKFAQHIDPSWALVSQAPGDLGQRMDHFFRQAFITGHQRVVLIGSDAPWIDAAVIEEAFAALDQHPVVIGPSHDGGYYLIGMNRPVVGLFGEIAWSSSQVFDQTCARLRQLGLSHCELATGDDIDTRSDLAKFIKGQQVDSTTAADLRELATRIEQLLKARGDEV